MVEVENGYFFCVKEENYIEGSRWYVGGKKGSGREKTQKYERKRRKYSNKPKKQIEKSKKCVRI